MQKKKTFENAKHVLFDKKEPKGGILRRLRRQGRRGLWVSKFQHLKLGPLWGQLQKELQNWVKNRKTPGQLKMANPFGNHWLGGKLSI